MAIDNSFVIRKIQKRTSMIVAYSGFTNMPFLTCDEESGNDQVWIFKNQELLQNFAKPYLEKKIPMRGMEYKNKDFLRFFSMLFTIGVNELVFVDDNDVKTTIELEKMVRRPDYSRLKPEQRPVLNPNLQLTGLYFVQAAGEQAQSGQKQDLSDMEEELASNLLRGRYLLAIELPEGPESIQEKLKSRQYKLPIIKDKAGNMFQPIFTDPIELEKFTRGKKNLTAIGVPFDQLERLLAKDAKGYMLNPAGYHIQMPRELLRQLPQQFEQEESEEPEDGQE